jgi:Ran GTPase-activating protein (RanGAP) involved in mRNA processing and transport
VIDLSCNNICDKGAEWIADVIKQNNTLEEIFLSRNNVGDEGAKWIADAIKENSMLRAISLCGNNIGDEGVKWIAKGLEMNRRLCFIDMAENYAIGEKKFYLEFMRYVGLACNGFECIAQALEKNKSLETLILNEKWVSHNKSRYDSIQQMLENNKNERILRTRFLLFAFLKIVKCKGLLGFDKEILGFYYCNFLPE